MGILTPYLTYIKIGIIAIALSASAWTGHEWTRRGYEAKEAKYISAAAATYEKSVKAYEAKIVELEQNADEAVGKMQSRVAALSTDNQKLSKDIRNATKNQPACTFTAGFGSVWNDSTNRANGQGVPAGAENPESAPSANGAATDITRESLLTNHDAVTQICGKWKAQLDSIIEWDARIK